jgi:hypothetical protein
MRCRAVSVELVTGGDVELIREPLGVACSRPGLPRWCGCCRRSPNHHSTKPFHGVRFL